MVLANGVAREGVVLERARILADTVVEPANLERDVLKLISGSVWRRNRGLVLGLFALGVG